MSWCRSSASTARRRPTNLFPLSTYGRPPSPPKALRTALTFRSGDAGPPPPPPEPWGQNEALSVPGAPPSLRADASSLSRQRWSWGFLLTPLSSLPSSIKSSSA